MLIDAIFSGWAHRQKWTCGGIERGKEEGRGACKPPEKMA